jgi:hypothetical protein
MTDGESTRIVVRRLIPFILLEDAVDLAGLLQYEINRMRKQIVPIEDYHTRVWANEFGLMLMLEVGEM